MLSRSGYLVFLTAAEDYLFDFIFSRGGQYVWFEKKKIYQTYINFIYISSKDIVLFTHMPNDCLHRQTIEIENSNMSGGCANTIGFGGPAEPKRIDMVVIARRISHRPAQANRSAC